MQRTLIDFFTKILKRDNKPRVGNLTDNSIISVSKDENENIIYNVCVNGEFVEVKESVLIESYSNKLDYDIARLSLMEELKELKKIRAENFLIFRNMENFSNDWAENPINVLINLLLTTDNPDESLIEFVNRAKSLNLGANIHLSDSDNREADLEHEWELFAKYDEMKRKYEKLEYDHGISQSILNFNQNFDLLTDKYNLKLSTSERNKLKRAIADYSSRTGITNIEEAFLNLKEGRKRFSEKFWF